ncbi:sulfide/dihydroorotate dehydrogenase-like FAD/NAD-binding protein [Aeoliella sp. ICT_H6.2]|uniref:Sulfide/dihydroorotate dehydrogenase-like FAD/NAD-binding protein n=1 Tax=Aeoliella straminimaris TaxID=2954799 RepID=A0A9X2F6K9_9BACT|nr:sulfide/dihydroorotate dehydrogenase-like FAD/NAD-binding protein [Aeoliella straminimaris]MCO6043232.1 sulfide/dihydroorotate dehydrogenase-like FAD/NAD-binding protein [Aeoliella straminimaris]
MFAIAEATFLAPDVKRFRIEAPRVARNRKAGQFVIVRVEAEHGERIPLTIADSDPEAGTITIIVQGVGKTTKMLNRLEAGDTLPDVVGPLGEPSDIQNFGTVVVVGGGVGTAIAYPTAVAMKQAGNRVLGIVGARTRELLILEEEMSATTDELHLMTDDGSYGQQGFVTQKLQQLIDEGEEIDHVLAIGPIPMMAAIADVTRPYDIKTVVSLNPIMVDGTGMCGGCRVTVGGVSKFACVDGPEFDAHEVDFKILSQRNKMYREREKRSLEEFEMAPQPELDRVHACHLQQEHPEVGPRVGGA